MVNRVKVHAQMIIENAADPYHVQYVHKAANPANTTSFEVSAATTCTRPSTRTSAAAGRRHG
jgi:phenylpropionate dioxygenase-like ring-hydroxylating dioxygenase large terminal subunit